MKYNLDFLKDDIQTGLLKNIPVGMIRRTLKRIDGKDISDFIYLPFKTFQVLHITDRFNIKELKGGINNK